MPFIISNIKTISYAVIALVIGLFLTWSIYNYKEKIRLKEQNQILEASKKTQENIINIHDENLKKSQAITDSVKRKIEWIKDINAKNEDDFLKQSECIFKNFGIKDYECV